MNSMLETCPVLYGADEATYFFDSADDKPGMNSCRVGVSQKLVNKTDPEHIPTRSFESDDRNGREVESGVLCYDDVDSLDWAPRLFEGFAPKPIKEAREVGVCIKGAY